MRCGVPSRAPGPVHESSVSAAIVANGTVPRLLRRTRTLGRWPNDPRSGESNASYGVKRGAFPRAVDAEQHGHVWAAPDRHGRASGMARGTAPGRCRSARVFYPERTYIGSVFVLRAAQHESGARGVGGCPTLEREVAVQVRDARAAAFRSSRDCLNVQRWAPSCRTAQNRRPSGRSSSRKACSRVAIRSGSLCLKHCWKPARPLWDAEMASAIYSAASSQPQCAGSRLERRPSKRRSRDRPRS